MNDYVDVVLNALEHSGFEERFDPSRMDAEETLWQQVSHLYDLLHIGAQTAKEHFLTDDIKFVVGLFSGTIIDWTSVVAFPFVVSDGVDLDNGKSGLEYSSNLVEKVEALNILERAAFVDAIVRFWANPSPQRFDDLDVFWFDTQKREATTNLIHIGPDNFGL